MRAVLSAVFYEGEDRSVHDHLIGGKRTTSEGESVVGTTRKVSQQ